MPLTKAQAKRLHEVIFPKNMQERIAKDKSEWNNAFLGAPIWKQRKNYDGLQDELIKARKKSLDRKTVVVDFDGKPVRVYPPSQHNIEGDVDDVFARGLDSARAVTEILKHHPAQMALLRNPALRELTALLDKFQSNMKVHRNNPDNVAGLENARKELARFNGALTNCLVRNNVVKNKGEAIAAINFVRDFLWKKDISMPICVIENPKTKTQSLRYAEPMEFGKAEFKRTDSVTNEPLNFWDDSQPWKVKLATAVGGGKERAGWFEAFMDNNLEVMKKQSSTPMSRYTPNPANAFDCTDIIVDTNSDEVIHLSSHERVAVTEPLSVANTKSRQDVTDWNHLQLVSKSRLQSGLNRFMEKWGAIIGDAPIPYTILHQTLIGDEVTLSPDQIKAKASRLQASVIDSKAEANAAVRKMLEKSTIFREKTTGEIKFLSNENFAKSPYNGQTPEGWQKVNVDLLETNNGVNMWSARTRIRNNDYNDARQLIGNAVNMFNKVQNKYPNQDLKTITDFLNSSDHSLITPFKYRGKDVKAAVKNLTEELRKNDGQFTNLAKDVRENIALSIQAAVELKCTVHETWLGSARRNIANFTRDYVRQIPILGHVVDWTVRGAMALAAVGLKIVAGILTLPVTVSQGIMHWGDRREMYKNTYEGILAESLGSLRGGCMSSADRALEVAEQRAMMKKQFAEEGEILSYNDSPAKKAEVYRSYGSTQTKHACAENATGTSGTNDGETRGLIFLNARAGVMSYAVETSAEQQLAEDLSGLRKGKYSKVSVDKYLSDPAVGEEAPKVKEVNVSHDRKSVNAPLPIVQNSNSPTPEPSKDEHVMHRPGAL